MTLIDEIYAVYGISYILYLSIISLSAFLGSYLFYKVRKKPEDTGKKNLYTLSAGFFFLIEAISHIFRWFFMFIYPMNLLMFYDIVMATTRTDPGLIGLVFVHISLIFYGCGFLAFGVESEIITRTKYIFTILILIFSSIIVFTPYQLAVTIQIIPISVIFFILGALVVIYFNHAFRNSGKIRRKFLLIGFGFCLFFTGIIINSQGFRVALHLPTTLYTITIDSPIFIIAGLIFLFLGFKRTNI